MGWSGCVTNGINHLGRGGGCLQHLIVFHKSRREASEARRDHFLKMQSLRLFLGFLNPSIYKSLDLGKLPAPPRAAAVQPKSLKQTPFHACRGQRPRFCCLCEYDLSLSCVSFCSGNLVPGEVILDTAGSS